MLAGKALMHRFSLLAAPMKRDPVRNGQCAQNCTRLAR